METSTLTFWNSGVWLIPIILIATIVILYLLSRQMRKTTQNTLKKVRTVLRSTESQRKTIASQVESFAGYSKEPYRTRTLAVQENLQSIQAHTLEYDKQLISIQHELRHVTSAGGLAIIGAPLIWYQLLQRSQKLLQAVGGLQPFLVEAEAISQELLSVAWEVAQRTRKVRDLHTEDNIILDKFIKEQAIGASLEKALHHQEAVRDALATIPGWLLEGNQETVRHQASLQDEKQVVIAVHETLTNIEPAQESTHTKVTTWERESLQANKLVEQLGAQLEKDAHLLDGSASWLESAAERQALTNMGTIFESLRSTLARLDVDSLGTMIAEARRVLNAAHNLEDQVVYANKALADLNSLLPAMTKELQNITMQFAVLGTSTIRPITWGKGRAALTNLNRQVKALSQIKQARSAGEIAQEVETARRLQQKVSELSSYSRDISAGHSQLRDLLIAPEFKDWKKWLSEAHILADRTSQYAPENWPRSDVVTGLPGDLAALKSELEALVGDDLSRPIDEADVAQVLADTSKLLPVYQAQRSRVANIQDRLAEIQSIERNSQEQLDKAAAFLQQVALLIQSSTFLKDKVNAEAGRLLKAATELSDELRQHDRGSLEKKHRQVETLTAKITTAAGKWLDLLNAEISSQVTELAGKIAALDAIASLDEPALERARQLFSNAPAYTVRSSGEGTSTTEQPALLELRRRCEFLENLAASQRALGNTADDILVNYEDASANRQIARQRIQEISNQFRKDRGWPPSTVTFLEERQEMGALEEQWEALKGQRMRGVTLAAQLGSLSARYQSLGGKVRQALERAAQDQERVNELENEFSENIQQWQVQARAYSANPLAAQEIRNLLANAERELADIRKGYQQGARNYTQVLQAMRLLVRNMGIALVLIDEEHSIDIRGRVIRAR